MLLNCHTYYSFCYGTLSTEDLLSEIKTNGYDSFALTDINNTSATLDAIRIAEEKGLKPVIGIDFRNGVEQKYIGIALNNEGFKELNEHLSNHLHSSTPFENTAPDFNHVFVVYPFAVYKDWRLKENEFVGVSAKDLSTLSFLSAGKLIKKMVVLQAATFADKNQFNAHRLLRAIDKNTLLSKLPITEQSTLNEIIPIKENLITAFSEYPEIVRNTEYILQQCTIKFEFGKLSNKNLKHYTNSVSEDIALLKSECEKGLNYRFKNPSKEVLDRVQKELRVIEQMNFSSYFLINWDIITYAKHKNYYHVGRGSGANSMVAYLLRITDVDPIELDLYFERFINPFRSNAPDFDIDFSWTDRDDITRYIFERFGQKRTALLGAYNTFQHDAVIRQLGKVFGLPSEEIDKLQSAKSIHDLDELSRLVVKYGNIIKGFPSHLSIHSSGIIISEEPIHTYTATNLPPKGYPTTQFSMLEAEDIGLYKFDILSQRGLGKIKDALTLVKENKQIEIDVHDINEFKKDEKVKDLLRTGNTIGCFYVESPAMRMLLVKLKADDYLRLVAASSIIRPGVSKSGMMREYIVRFRDTKLREKAKAKLPELYDILSETYGVMVYQEDVIKVAHLFAGLTLAEADYLRRGMSWKFKQRNEFALVRKNFFSNCRKKGYEERLVGEIWNQIESFASFAFSKGHSASYAVESYQALYLKAHYPLEYMVATLNNGGGFYRKDVYLHEAKMNGAIIFPPCVNHSADLCTLQGKNIFLGLSMVAELEHNVIAEILQERNKNGLYLTLDDFIKRTNLSIEQMRILIRVGAFNFSGKNKKELMWEIHMLMNPIKKESKSAELFEVKTKKWELPKLSDNRLDQAFDEIELLGFSLQSPFELLRDELPSKLAAKDLLSMKNQTVRIVGYLVNIKYTSTGNGQRMYFGTFLDTEGAWIDTVHFPDSAAKYKFSGPGCYDLTGKVTEEYDFLTLEVSAMKRLSVVDREAV